MKAKSKSSKKVTKKPVAKKKMTSAVKKKRAAVKSVKKAASAKKTRSASKTAKRAVAKKQRAAAARKKKSPTKPVRRSAAKKPAPAEVFIPVIQETIVSISEMTPGDAMPSGTVTSLLLGRVAYYDSDSNVAIIQLDAGNLRVGDTIQFKGHTTDAEHLVDSIMIEDQDIDKAEAGQTVSVKVRGLVHEHDKVYKKWGT